MKRGHLSLSTNAIVVLLVSVVLLGLVITFALRGFGSIDAKLSQDALTLTDPPKPTSVQPITATLARTATIGGDFLAKVSVYNPCTSAITVQVTDISCTDPAVPYPVSLSSLSNAVSLQPNQVGTVSFVGMVESGVAPGKSICTLSGEFVAVDAPADCSFTEARASYTLEFVP